MENNYVIKNTTKRQTPMVQERISKHRLGHKVAKTDTEPDVKGVGRKEGEMPSQEGRRQQLLQEQESRNGPGTYGEW